MGIVGIYLHLLGRWRWSLLLAILLGTIAFDTARGSGALLDSARVAVFALLMIGTVQLSSLARPLRRAATWLVSLWCVLAVTATATQTALFDGPMTLLTLAISLGATAMTLVSLTGELHEIDRLVGAVYGFFLIGLTWGLLFHQLEIWQPGSFTLDPDDPSGPQLIYFSLVTLTTLGYGEITPQTPPARLVAGLEAVFGTLYIAIFIGQIAGRLSMIGPGGRDRR